MASVFGLSVRAKTSKSPVLPGAHARPCSCHSAVLVPVGALAPWCSSGPCARVIVRCSCPSVLLLVRYSSGGRAATRPLLVQRRAATRPLLVRRPCCYSSATRPAAVLLLVRYSSAAVLLLVRYSSGGRAAARPGRHWWAAATGVCKYPQKNSFLEPLEAAPAESPAPSARRSTRSTIHLDDDGPSVTPRSKQVELVESDKTDSAHPFAEKINWYAVCADERKGAVIEASAFRCSPPASNPNPPPPLPLPTCMCWHCLCKRRLPSPSPLPLLSRYEYEERGVRHRRRRRRWRRRRRRWRRRRQRRR